MNNNSNHHHPHEMYYDQQASRSPGAHRHQPQALHRQPSRQFDAYSSIPSNPYQPEDHTTMRYDANRFERMNPSMQGGSYGYDVPNAQTWNPNAFNGANGFPAFGATGRMKSAPRGRSALPPVCITDKLYQCSCFTYLRLDLAGSASASSRKFLSQHWPFTPWDVSSPSRSIRGRSG